MFSKIRIKNFKSIEDLLVDFSYAEGKAPNNYKDSNIISFLEPNSKADNRVVSVMNMYGANASGKSNIIEVLSHITNIIRNGLKPDYPFCPNKLKKLENETLIQMNFFINKHSYEYSIAYNNKTITMESLYLEGKKLFSIDKTESNFEGIKTRAYGNKVIRERFQTSCLTLYDEEVNQINTFLSSVVSDLPSLNKNLTLVFNFLTKKIAVLRDSAVHASHGVNLLSKSQQDKDIKIAFDKITEIIKELDIDINKFEYENDEEELIMSEKGEVQVKIPANSYSSYKIDKAKNRLITNRIKSYHTNSEGKEVPFDIAEESVGTRVAFGLVGFILKTLEDGGVLIIDELDRSLHTLILKRLVRMFKDKDLNRNNAQLISTLHNTDILEDSIYKISEFAFINKNQKRGTFIKRLSDYEGVRNDMNFRDRYLDGLYLGIPYPYN
ncbi:ATP-binding protein [bacterium]|nr:ATP-binding protein [bacterium]NCQ55928.1 ATP-binding protein [Candidatus Parcubacteria bacterium]NCS67953.1 ATP-binding protein [Candidatus Peregrinibacteria bacterium]NCS96847.1 ATP-binding protein [bacterium]